MPPPGQALLKAAILAWETCEALAVVFLVDRFLYWSDESPRLLSLTKRLHRRQPGAPVAPQLVLRQARVYLNSGEGVGGGGGGGGAIVLLTSFEPH